MLTSEPLTSAESPPGPDGPEAAAVVVFAAVVAAFPPEFEFELELPEDWFF